MIPKSRNNVRDKEHLQPFFFPSWRNSRAIFLPRSDDEDGAWAATRISRLPPRTSGRAFGYYVCSGVPLTRWILVESGFEPGALQHRSRDLATRPPRPQAAFERNQLGKVESWES
ncbi:hypothetical protein AVEN_37838-1 [Araneus ventricosus]|uniref:Uncharacterized protein n=1 Tax=Araneus ventricosus TaxID=182803 RepID=A0A4Y2T103_ARAVE|nr:hypothetical protein AVEN_37838-1 [Araneus ventricosus]